MNSITLMVAEHDNILRMNAVMRKACEAALEGGDIDVPDFRQMIDFVRNYADKHHHGKEEQILFAEMESRLGNIAVNLIRHGMLVEHDMGRMFIGELEAALDAYEANRSTSAKLDILANAVSYAALLKRHIGKENDVVYPYAQAHLDHAVMEQVERATGAFESREEAAGVADKYLSMLQALERKYR